jgi:fluoride exporter
MLNLLLLALGGTAGTLARYGTSVSLMRFSTRAAFPFGTLAVNLIGCLLIGYLHGAFAQRAGVRPEYQLLLITGFLGGFTTFSAFGWETATMLNSGAYGRAALYLAISNGLGVALVLAGHAIGMRHHL